MLDPIRYTHPELTRYTNPKTKETTIFVPLPPSQWRVPDGGCVCDVCKRDGTIGFWDTLVIGAKYPKPGMNDFASTCHYPELHPIHIREQKSAEYRATLTAPVILPTMQPTRVILAGELRPDLTVLEHGVAYKVLDVRHMDDGYTYWGARALTGSDANNTRPVCTLSIAGLTIEAR